MTNLLVQGWALIVGGAVILGVGGTLTTLGWNVLNQRSQKLALLNAVVLECQFNEKLLTGEKLFNGRDEEHMASHRLYPRFRFSALRSALASGFFVTGHGIDSAAYTTMIDYDLAIEDVNAKLDVSDKLVTSTADKNVIQEHRKMVLSSDGFTTFVSHHRKMLSRMQAIASGKQNETGP